MKKSSYKMKKVPLLLQILGDNSVTRNQSMHGRIYILLGQKYNYVIEWFEVYRKK